MRDLISALSNPVSGFPSPFGGRRRWSPRALFANGEAGALYLPGPDTCFQDAAGTTPAGDGDPVGYLADLSGNGNHATQATSAARPTLTQDGSGNWYLDFDGVDDVLRCASLVLAAPRYVVIASDPDVASDKHSIFYNNTTTGYQLGLYQQPLGRAVNTWNADLTGDTSATYDAAVDTVKFADGLPAAACEHWHNGVAATMSVQTGSPISRTIADGIQIGQGDIAGAHSLKGAVFGVVVIGALSSADRARAEAYLANLSGVTL